jgi:hypothetical protein
MTLTGTQAQLNAALASLAYAGAADWSGADTLTVTTTDPVGAASAGAVNLAIAAVNDAPAIGNNSFAIAAGSTTVLGTANLSATDVDNAAAGLAFQIGALANGQFELVSAPGVAISTFTQAQLAGGQVQFVHAGTGAPSFTILLSDGTALAGPYAASISFTPAAAPAAADPLAPPTPKDAPITLAALGPAGVLSTTTTDVATGIASAFYRGHAPAGDRDGDANFAEAAAQAVAAAPARVVRADSGVIETATQRAPDAGFGPLRAEAGVIDTALQLADTRMGNGRGTLLAGDAGSSFAETDEERVQIEIVLGTVRVTGIALSVGAVWWAARAAGLVASLLTTTPAWRHVDPLPVLSRDPDADEEEVEQDKEKRDEEHRAAWVLEGKGTA